MSDPKSKFMQEFDALPTLKYYDDRETIIRRFEDLAELVGKHGVERIGELEDKVKELEEWVEVLRNRESEHDIFKRTGTGF